MSDLETKDDTLAGAAGEDTAAGADAGDSAGPLVQSDDGDGDE